MNTITNLSYATDCIVHRHDGFVDEHDGFWAIRTPDNPSFWFGNFLLFSKAPKLGDFAKWHTQHAHVFGDTLNHLTFGWDEDAPGYITEFITAGFRSVPGLNLTLNAAPHAVRINPDLVVRPIKSDAEWEAVAVSQIEVDRTDFDYPEDDGEFRRSQVIAARKLAEHNRGDWWGAFAGEKLVGSMGLYFDEARKLGRFQYVTTSPRHRRQRVCTTLLNHVTRHAFEHVGVKTLVIHTGDEDHNHAKDVYQNFGFRPTSKSYAVTRLLHPKTLAQN